MKNILNRNRSLLPQTPIFEVYIQTVSLGQISLYEIKQVKSVKIFPEDIVILNEEW